MHDGRKLEREGGSTIEYLQYGNHEHAFVYDESAPLRKTGIDENNKAVMARRTSVQGPCKQCERENEAFRVWSADGSEISENEMYKVKSYRAYHQKWPFDARKNVLSAEVVFEENDGVVYVEKPTDKTTLDLIMDDESVDEVLADLDDEEKEVIKLTMLGGYKPREIATMRGEKTSGRVRQLKYSALRKLGAPVKISMRRGSK